MTFTLLPAVDVAQGRSVRLASGESDSASDDADPLEVALAWQTAGAEWVHLVDLDAAFGRGANSSLLGSVVGELDIDVELAGGVCDSATLDRALATGCARVSLSTVALDDPAWCASAIAEHGDRIAVSLDVKTGEATGAAAHHTLAARGTSRDGGDLWEALDWLDRAGCARYIVTDVRRDGMLNGPNVELYRAVTDVTPAEVIASGGISSLADLVALAEGTTLEGAVVGKALYVGRFTLPEALQAVERR